MRNCNPADKLHELCVRIADPNVTGVHLVVAPVGAGAGTVAVELVCARAAQAPGDRILLVESSSEMAAMMAARLQVALPGRRVVHVGRRAYRALQAAATGPNEVLPPSSVIVVDARWMRFPDVRVGMLATAWALVVIRDQVVVDEKSDQDDSLALLAEVHRVGQGRPVVLISAIARNLSHASFGIQSTTDFAAAVRPEECRPARRVEWRRSKSELTLGREVVNLCADMVGSGLSRLGEDLAARSESSVYALQQGLAAFMRRLRNARVHGSHRGASVSDLTRDEWHSSAEVADLSEETCGRLIGRMNLVLDCVGDVPADSKAEVLCGMISGLTRPDGTLPGVVVVSRFEDTVDYLCSVLTGAGIPARCLRLDASQEQVGSVLRAVGSGGATVLPYKALVGFEFPSELEMCVAYDAFGGSEALVLQSRARSSIEVCVFQEVV